MQNAVYCFTTLSVCLSVCPSVTLCIPSKRMHFHTLLQCKWSIILDFEPIAVRKFKWSRVTSKGGTRWGQNFQAGLLNYAGTVWPWMAKLSRVTCALEERISIWSAMPPSQDGGAPASPKLLRLTSYAHTVWTRSSDQILQGNTSWEGRALGVNRSIAFAHIRRAVCRR